MDLDPNFAIAWARLSRADAHLYFNRSTLLPRSGGRSETSLENAQKLEPDSPETLLALGYYQYRVLGDYGPAKPRSIASAKCYPVTAKSDGPSAHCPMGANWDQSNAYFEQALALDPRNVDILRGGIDVHDASTMASRA